MITWFSPLRLLLLAGLVVSVVTGFVLVPADASLPVHWGLTGEPDRFLPRSWALAMPIIFVVLVWGIIYFADRLGRPAERPARAAMFDATLTGLTAVFLAISATTVAIGLGLPVSMVQVISIALAILLLLLGNVMPKSRPNGYAGLRIPTTLASERNWQLTHRLTGYLAITGGLLLLPAAILVPVPYLIWCVLLCLLSPMLAGALYSLLLARRGT